MRKSLVSALAAAMISGAAMVPAEAAPIAAPAAVVGNGADIVKVGIVCGPGRHLGPLGRCRTDGALPIFSYRKPCPPGFHRNFVGLCRVNRL